MLLEFYYLQNINPQIDKYIYLSIIFLSNITENKLCLKKIKRQKIIMFHREI